MRTVYANGTSYAEDTVPAYLNDAVVRDGTEALMTNLYLLEI